MGMVGSYCAHFFCDCCKKFWEADQVDTASAARKQMRDIGWKLNQDGTVICPSCSAENLLPEYAREGGDWHNY